jgi:hypothetical protein
MPGIETPVVWGTEESKDEDSDWIVVVVDKLSDEVIVPEEDVAVSGLPVVEGIEEVETSTDDEPADDAEKVWD